MLSIVFINQPLSINPAKGAMIMMMSWRRWVRGTNDDESERMKSAKDEFLAPTPVGRDARWRPAQHLPPPSTWLTGSCSTTFAVAAPLAAAVASCRCLPTNKITRSFPLPVHRFGGAAEEMSKCWSWAWKSRHAGVRRDSYNFFRCEINFYACIILVIHMVGVKIYINAFVLKEIHKCIENYTHNYIEIRIHI